MIGSRVVDMTPDEVNRILEEIYRALADLAARLEALEAKA